jgi:GMP synthase-like glutamine amidotransferase
MTAERAVLVLQHIACEPPAAYADELAARAIPVETVEIDRLEDGASLPDWRAYEAIIAMGGPMGAYEDELYRWLVPEKTLISEAAHAGVPFWGVCLGAQLLAAALGARVEPGPAPEIGVLPVRLDARAHLDPVFATAPASFEALHWHGDTYTLPSGAALLASSERYEQQAFVFRRAYGIQFHVEVGPHLLREWGAVPAYRDSLARAQGEGSLETLLGAAAEAEGAMNNLARDLFGRFLDEVVAASSPAQNATGLPAGTTSTEPREASSTERAKPLSATRPPGAPG